MIGNYLKIAFRFLLKNKTYSLINIIGLAAGTLCCLYIILYVADQYSYDKYYKDAKDIYRIDTHIVMPNSVNNSATTSPPIAPVMKNDFPEVEQYTRFIGTTGFGVKEHLIRYKEKSFYENSLIFADSTFFDVFNFRFVFGQPNDALKEAYSVVLMKPIADKLFGKEDPIGKLIDIDDSYGSHPFKVTGVVDESLGKSSFKANIFITMNSGGMGSYTQTDTKWAGDNFAYSFVKLHTGTNPAGLEKKLPAFLNKYGEKQLKAMGMQKQLYLQPIGTIHITSGFEHTFGKTVSSSFLDLLLLIAGLIQIIACINFMNLSTARASKRAKEVGVRKVVGAGKTDLIKQFIGESFLLSLIGVLIALPLLVLALPYLNNITRADVHLSLLSDPRIIILLVSLVLITGLVAGSYPAFYLSAFRPIKVLKGNFTNRVSAAGLRRSLVVFQFVLSVVLITGATVIYSQLHYMENKDLGFDKSQKLIFTFYTDSSASKMNPFANELRQLPEVKVVSMANNYPSQFVGNDWPYYPTGGSIATSQDVQIMFTDHYFVRSLGIKMLSGRDFTINDSGKVLINETLARRLGLNPFTAIGQKLHPEHNPGDPDNYVEIAGVFKDFNYNSLHDEINPLMLSYAGDGTSGWDVSLTKMIVSTTSPDYKGLLDKMESIWHKLLPGEPFQFSFLDEEVQQQYQSEMILSNIINSFTLVAILISCLGLFGLAAFSAEQRIKEIGIRKVMGASITGIVGLLSKDFLKLVAAAMVIAIPIAWWAMSKWLQGFAYRVPVRWWMFALSGMLAILIALLTVSFQAFKAAIANPVNSLRSE